MNEPNASTNNNQAGEESGSQEQAANHADCEKQIAKLETQLKEKEDKYLYLYAEFENFKKRAIKERSDLLKYGWEPAARELLQVVDNLERAIAHIPPSTDKKLAEGLEMVLNQFKSVLGKQGIQDIQSINQDFDPNLHEAVGQEPSDQPAGKVVKEHMRGYTLHGRLLRPARVVVSGGNPAQAS